MEQLIKITNKNKLNGKEVKFSFVKDTIILTFNINDILDFSNTNDGVISRTVLMARNFVNSTINKFIKNEDLDNSNKI